MSGSNAKSIIKRFDENQELFEKTFNELMNSNYKYIYLETYYGDVQIFVYVDNIRMKLDEEKHDEFKEMLNIYKVLELDTIKKDNDMLEFSLDSEKYILYTEDIESYEYYDDIIEKENIKNNWYYIKVIER